MKFIISVFIILSLAACSDADTPQKVEQDHVWKEQTDMINKAKGVEQLLQDTADKQAQLIQEKTQ